MSEITGKIHSNGVNRIMEGIVCALPTFVLALQATLLLGETEGWSIGRERIKHDIFSPSGTTVPLKI